MARRNEQEIIAWDRHLSRTYGETKALFTIAEACEIIGCSIPTLYGMMAEKRLAVRRVGSSPRITRLSLLEYLSDRPAPVSQGSAPAAPRPEQGSLF